MDEVGREDSVRPVEPAATLELVATALTTQLFMRAAAGAAAARVAAVAEGQAERKAARLLGSTYESTQSRQP